MSRQYYNHPIVFLLAGALIFWISSSFRKPADPPLLPSGEVRADPSTPTIFPTDPTDGSPMVVGRPIDVKFYAFDRELDERTTQVIVVDSESKRLCVYHVNANGQVEFVGNRNFKWDLAFDNFNGVGMTPAEVKDYIEKNNLPNR